MKKTNSNIAFVYHYWNIETLESYYGYKESWNKKYSPFEIFVEHPMGERSTDSHYCSSCKQKEWKEACKNGEIYGEIIAIFTGENAGNLAHEYEHQMIITHKALYGQETLYNRNDGYAKFSTANPTEEESKKYSNGQRKRYEDPKEHEKTSIKTKEAMNRPEVKIKTERNNKRNSELQKKRYEDPKEREKTSIATKKGFTQEIRKNISDKGKKRFEDPKERELQRQRLINNPKRSKIVLQYTLDGEFIREWPSMAEIIRNYGHLHISECCNGIRNHSGGFIWKFKEDIKS